MNQNSFRSLQVNFSGISFWLTLLLIVWLLGAIGLGWLVKSFFILIGLLLLAPVVAFFVFRWWLQRNLVESACPVCSYEFVGIHKTETRCPSCGEPLQVERKGFARLTPPGTVDVEAIEVTPKRLSE